MRRLALLALAAPLLLASPAWAQEPTAAPAPPAAMGGHAHAMGPGMAMGEGGGGCAAMMAHMDSANARIATLTETMNKASGSKKTEAMAAVVNAMVQDRLAMQGMMHEMHSHMEQMMKGGMGGMSGMAGCSAGMECCKGAGMSCGAAAAPAPEKKE